MKKMNLEMLKECLNKKYRRYKFFYNIENENYIKEYLDNLLNNNFIKKIEGNYYNTFGSENSRCWAVLHIKPVIVIPKKFESKIGKTIKLDLSIEKIIDYQIHNKKLKYNAEICYNCEFREDKRIHGYIFDENYIDYRNSRLYKY